MSELLLLLLYVAILAIPFQLMGAIAYLLMRKRNLKRARLAGLLVPPSAFFIVFLGIYLWQQSKPPSGLIPMLDGFMLRERGKEWGLKPSDAPALRVQWHE